MTQKSTKAILSIALCTCLLSGCSISITPASSSASSTPLSNSENNSDTNSTDTSASAPHLQLLLPRLPLMNLSSRHLVMCFRRVLPPKMNKFPYFLIMKRKNPILLYIPKLWDVFSIPYAKHQRYSFRLFFVILLLYQTFERNGEGSSYTQNSNFSGKFPKAIFCKPPIYI